MGKMYIIDQQIANQIAQTIPLQVMQSWFQAREEEVEELESGLINEIINETGACIVGVAVTAILPLVVESEAISRYINQTQDYSLRLYLPEIKTVHEARLLAEKEFTMTKKQGKKVEEKISQLWSQLILTEYSEA